MNWVVSCGWTHVLINLINVTQLDSVQTLNVESALDLLIRLFKLHIHFTMIQVLQGSFTITQIFCSAFIINIIQMTRLYHLHLH